MTSRLGHRVELALARAAIRLVRALGPIRSSNLGGWLARGVGPWLPASRVADTNLRLALPGLDRTARRRIVRGAWENLGRTVAEMPHLQDLAESAGGVAGWDLEGAEHLDALRRHAGPAMLFSAHLGNWELLPRVAAAHGVPLAIFYRAAENPGIDALLTGLRFGAWTEGSRQFPKGASGARQALAYLRRGGKLAGLVDQKMNDGVEARLFGRPAMTAPGLAAMALRLDCPLLPAFCQRTGPARFHVVVEPPLALPRTGDKAADLLALTQAMNDRIEAHVRARPEQWLWLHRRWDKRLYRREGQVIPSATSPVHPGGSG